MMVIIEWLNPLILASTMNPSGNIVIEEDKVLTVQQGVQYRFAKFKFIDHMCTNEQDCR